MEAAGGGGGGGGIGEAVLNLASEEGSMGGVEEQATGNLVTYDVVASFSDFGGQIKHIRTCGTHLVNS